LAAVIAVIGEVNDRIGGQAGPGGIDETDLAVAVSHEPGKGDVSGIQGGLAETRGWKKRSYEKRKKKRPAAHKKSPAVLKFGRAAKTAGLLSGNVSRKDFIC
jgi:hypothetical protein